MRTVLKMRFGDSATINDMKKGMVRELKAARIKPKSIEITKIIRHGSGKFVDFLVKW